MHLMLGFLLFCLCLYVAVVLWRLLFSALLVGIGLIAIALVFLKPGIGLPLISVDFLVSYFFFRSWYLAIS